MDNRTQVNSLIHTGNATEINNVVVNNNATEINQEMVQAVSLPVGTLLCGKYEVVSKLYTTTGEADLYICNYNEQAYVAKVYRREVAIKPEVIDVLKRIDSPYIAKVFETGEVNGTIFEIISYYKNGSLQGKQFSFDELKSRIIPSVNEGLKALHKEGMIHKDLKPSNIMLCDNGMDVSIIDFGISSVRNEGNTVLLTKTGMTPEYSAPETFRNLFLEESDYYSFGITLFELFCGYTPYANMNQDEIAQYVSVQKIPIPREMPRELADLINALTYYDITNRRNKNNPNRRWTYEEVSNWCSSKKQIIPGEGTGNSNVPIMPPYTFKNQSYTDILSLVKALAENWNDGKKELFRGILSGFFKGFNPQIAGYCMDAEDEAKKISGKDDIIFWKLLYKLAPNIKTFYWKGVFFESLPALGRDMLEKLWSGNKSGYEYYDSILSEKLLSNYVELYAPDNTDLKNAVDSIETMKKVSDKDNREKVYYMMAYMLSGQKIFNFDGNQFRTIGELTTYMKGLLDNSYETFQAFCHKLVDFDDNLDVQLECWLITLGKRNELEQWRNSLTR